MKKLILVRGCSGSGKTTFAGLLSEYVISADDYFTKNGEYKFDATKLHFAHQYSINATETGLLLGSMWNDYSYIEDQDRKSTRLNSSH